MERLTSITKLSLLSIKERDQLLELNDQNHH